VLAGGENSLRKRSRANASAKPEQKAIVWELKDVLEAHSRRTQGALNGYLTGTQGAYRGEKLLARSAKSACRRLKPEWINRAGSSLPPLGKWALSFRSRRLHLP
jgi:hypothetical protein